MEDLHVDIAIDVGELTVAAVIDVPAGQTHAIVGPSGSGKTTILRVIAGLARPRSGRITLGADTWFDAARGVNTRVESRGVGMLFQDASLFPHLSVMQNVRFGAPSGVADTELLDLLELLGISALAQARCAKLSGGERQRVALARALAQRPRVLLLDEPTASLDSHRRTGVIRDLSRMLQRASVPTLLVTHSFEEAAALADVLHVIDAGSIVQRGSARELAATPGTPFVASLTGMNAIRGNARPGEGALSGLTQVAAEGGLAIVSTDSGDGDVMVLVAPQDVAIHVGADSGEKRDSMLNHVRAGIESIVPVGNRCRVRVGPIVAEITRSSCDRLGLTEQQFVTASFKAVQARLIPMCV